MDPINQKQPEAYISVEWAIIERRNKTLTRPYNGVLYDSSMFKEPASPKPEGLNVLSPPLIRPTKQSDPDPHPSPWTSLPFLK